MAPPVAEESTPAMTPHINEGPNQVGSGKILGNTETVLNRTYIK